MAARDRQSKVNGGGAGGNRTDNRAAKGLTIVHYDPSGKKKRPRREASAATTVAATARSSDQNEGQQADTGGSSGASTPRPVPSRLERIPSSRSWDPFNALAVLYISKEERFMLNYAYTRSWAVWADPTTGNNRFAQAWTNKAMESSACFYSQMVGASTHYNIARRDTPVASDKLAAVRLQCKAKAIEKLRHEINLYHNKSTSVPFDALLMAIFCLAVHDRIDEEEQPEAPMSLIARLRDMQVYYRVLFADEHMQIMYQLIEEHGGLDKLDKTAFGAVVPLLDMMYAARTRQAPRIPSLWTLRRSTHPTVWTPDEKAKDLLKVSGAYFKAGFEDPYVLDEDLCAALGALADVSVALDHFHREGPGIFKAAHIWLENSDWASHKLLSTPSYLRAGGEAWSLSNIPDVEDVDPSMLLCEIVRLTAMMYMDITIFPSGRAAGVRVRLGKELYLLLDLLDQVIPDWENCTEVYDLVLWAVMTCCMGLLPTDIHDRFVEYIAHMCSSSQLNNWENIERRLQAFLWLEPVFNEPARDICRDARMLQVADDEE